MLETIKNEAKTAAEEIISEAGLKKGQILIVGCSSSEVSGEKIGTYSSVDVAKAVFDGIYQVTNEHGIYIASQCCEHLNRAIIIERAAVPNYDIVNVVPQPKAGGSFATTAYNSFNDPVAVEEIKEVAVPVRLSLNSIGKALLLAARTRPKYIGGERAHYDEKLG